MKTLYPVKRKPYSKPKMERLVLRKHGFSASKKFFFERKGKEIGNALCWRKPSGFGKELAEHGMRRKKTLYIGHIRVYPNAKRIGLARIIFNNLLKEAEKQNLDGLCAVAATGEGRAFLEAVGMKRHSRASLFYYLKLSEKHSEEARHEKIQGL